MPPAGASCASLEYGGWEAVISHPIFFLRLERLLAELSHRPARGLSLGEKWTVGRQSDVIASLGLALFV